LSAFLSTDPILPCSVSPSRCSTPLPTGKAGDIEGGVPSADAELDRIKRTIVEMEKAVAVAAPEDRAEIQKSLDELRTAAARMAEVNTLASGQAVAHK
jgi:hypothetical protein